MNHTVLRIKNACNPIHIQKICQNFQFNHFEPVRYMLVFNEAMNIRTLMFVGTVPNRNRSNVNEGSISRNIVL